VLNIRRIARGAAVAAIAITLGLTAQGQESRGLGSGQATGSAIENEAVATAEATATPPATYIKTYANFVSTRQEDLTPEDVKATSDGGYILLGTTPGNGNLVSWLVKTDSSGNPKWQKELGCFNSPPGDYTIGASLQQTTDGGYIVGGGAIGCGSGSALVEKLDSTGNLLWAKTYPVGPNGGDFFSIKQTTDGGFVAAGSSFASGFAANGALVLKLDGSGNLQWQRVIGPAGSTHAWFKAVEQTSDGGYAAVGNFSNSSSEGALVVKLDSNGQLQWQRGVNQQQGQGPVTANAIVQTSDRGYMVFGQYFNNSSQGPLLVKLDAGGNLLSQKAYSGGQYCYVNGVGIEVCTNLSAYIYSVNPTPDGGFVLAGDENLKLNDSAPIEPWLAKVDSSGNLLWQHFYYQTLASTGRPLSEYFASSSLAKDGGFVALGWTEDYAHQLGLLYLVKTDSSGICASCSELHTATPLSAVDAGVTTTTPSLPVGTTAPPGVSAPSKTGKTAIKVKKDC